MTSSRSTPEVSVVLATYNHEAYVAQAIESVLAQRTDFDSELLIADDCSTDGTRAILETYQARHPGRIRLYLSPVNTNDNAEFARAWAQAGGRYIAMMDGDDYWTSPGKLKVQRDFLEAHETFSACFHNTEEVWEDKSRESRLMNEPDQKPIVTEQDLWVQNMIATCSALYRRSFVGALPAWYSSSIFGDWPIHMLSASRGPIGYIPEVMAAYRKHDKGQWSGMTEIDQELKVIAFLRQMNQLWGRSYDDLAGAGIVRQRLRLAACYRTQGDALGVSRSLAQALVLGVGNSQIGFRWLLSRLVVAALPGLPARFRKWKRS